MSDSDLAERVRDGDRRSLARLITAIEAGDPIAEAAVTSLIDSTAPTRRVGITGPPGAGKSTLVNAVVGELRSKGDTVAVLAVDPSSPITGGALLGDRIRMQGHAGDQGVYVRSMASRGHLGGLSDAAAPAIAVLARAGFDMVLIETVGVGQSELEVMDHVDLVVLVLGPGWGDQIQADKAGIVEIADVFVVNKGDRPGVDIVHLALLDRLGGSAAPVLITTALTGEGVSDLVEVIR
ncbi:MAG TPA: methylmalonyl Co-A mutase-associated GTPase MeaB [Acidimicrobiia bacterium]|jgi:LAO/AO transport system kinase|nr:methylmalonyl Co-A mutase-associated GTPase MeaB [Acidimicrobiia bacterium]